jgi:DNA-binding response OmpR family regulator
MGKRRILVIDNDKAFLDTRAEFLEKAGYKVLRAYTLEQAHALLTSAHVHLAILDIRMVDDDDEKDVSGLVLAKGIAPTMPVIILTGFPTVAAAREALRPQLTGLPTAVDFISKEQGPEVMIQAVEEALGHAHINWDLRIHWDPHQPLSFGYLADLIASAWVEGRPPDTVDELEEVFRKLFFAYEEITVARLLARRDGRTILAVLAYPQDGPERQFVVSCGLADRIRRENAGFKSVSATQRHEIATLEMSVATMRLAAAAYSLGGADLSELTPFSMFYRQQSPGDIETALEQLFTYTLGPWYATERILDTQKPLHAPCQERLSLDLGSAAVRAIAGIVQTIAREVVRAGYGMLEHAPNEIRLHLTDKVVSFPNPVRFLTDKQVPLPSPTLCCLTHGHLTADSILVDSQCRTWVIDFGDVAIGPVLLDYASLESAIKFDLSETRDLQGFLSLERALLSEEPSNVLDSQHDKPIQVVRRIRDLLPDAVKSEPRAYLVALLYTALDRLAEFETGRRYSRSEIAPYARALLSASVLYAQLADSADLRESLPERASTSIWIDETRREVWVEGRKADLTQNEFALLLCLYRRAGDVVSREEILQEMFPDEYKDTDLTARDINRAEESRLNTVVRRLRQEIERNPSQPRYIINERGVGYRLVL